MTLLAVVLAAAMPLLADVMPPVLSGMGLEQLGKSEAAKQELREKGLGP